jgi:hypothetical protein
MGNQTGNQGGQNQGGQQDYNKTGQGNQGGQNTGQGKQDFNKPGQGGNMPGKQNEQSTKTSGPDDQNKNQR